MRATCPSDQAHFPGEPGCAELGTRCDPLDDYAVDLPASGVVYVAAGAMPGGDGSRASPFASISEALAAGTMTGTIALSKGTHAESIVIGAGITIAGACVSETIWTSSSTAAPAMLQIASPGVGLRNRANTQEPTFDSNRLNNDVDYDDNVVSSDLSTLPVPRQGLEEE